MDNSTIDKRLDNHEDRIHKLEISDATTSERIDNLGNHEKRIQKLELSDATISEKMGNLIKSQENLVGWVKALVMVIATTLLKSLVELVIL